MTGGRAIRAETLKLLSLPATYFTLLGTFGVSVILAIAFSRQGVSPLGYTQAGFIVLGVIAATSEYSGGQIHRTLTAMPRRIVLQLSKMAALLIVAVPAAGLTALAGLMVTGGPLSDAVGASAYLTLTAVISAAVATILRRSVPAVAGLLGYYFIAGPLFRDRGTFAAYLPDAASRDLGALGGSAVALAWALLAVGVSATLFRMRDA
ncbi:hypothetical protein GCM10027598_46410 [Amycolatopsis oliviviridis]|uniref:ABC transporter permease n=1 Tax=Amycolatopsis oliviviridis TaxID=1471590 RepID=A0ABQ3LC83_9PSEU|nr:hypothetical protein [Amycolatopsis oliviviridis]GHH08529.1 hypothetical protein GCM10017790_15430 [Amycolatopsis oliviviridis]